MGLIRGFHLLCIKNSLGLKLAYNHQLFLVLRETLDEKTSENEIR